MLGMGQVCRGPRPPPRWRRGRAFRSLGVMPPRLTQVSSGAECPLPAPVRMTTARHCVVAQSPQIPLSALGSARLIALSACGRFSVTVAMPSVMSSEERRLVDHRAFLPRPETATGFWIARRVRARSAAHGAVLRRSVQVVQCLDVQVDQVGRRRVIAASSSADAPRSACSTSRPLARAPRPSLSRRLALREIFPSPPTVTSTATPTMA